MALLQHILVLWSYTPELTSPICAWTSYDPIPEFQPPIGLDTQPPFDSVLAALRDGWRIIQYPVALPAYPGMETDTNHLKHEFVLEKMMETSHV